ncbi:MAG: alkaline phosphatase family protein [Planctomycetes bacterium]|nr:alkaline phosphatase family protein [Planctomycetota bacterium]
MRTLWTILVAVALTVGMASCERDRSYDKKVIVIGMDGMDPRLCERMMDAGELPHLDHLRQAGGFKPLGTSMPPQSPVAWSNFITGADSGVHGVFDFIHRDPAQQLDYLYYGSADTRGESEGWEVGDHKIPLAFWPFNHKQPKSELLRQGVPFWDYLDEVGVPVWMYDLPGNYPPSESKYGHMCCLSGMGTPDLMGGLGGTYQYFSEDTEDFETPGGGMHNPLEFEGNTAFSELEGPMNSFLKRPQPTLVDITIHRHPTEPTARIDWQGQSIVLNEGEWSDWCKIAFEIEMPSFMPNSQENGICRFYLQEVRPNFRLYVTPINIDPSDPGGQVITEPAEFLEEISEELGLFYTTGFQEDHKALSNKVFVDREYQEQSNFVLDERFELLDYALDRYEGGLLFFYFSSTDVQAHMFWWDSDEPHPVRSPADATKYNGAVMDVYRKMDGAVGKIVERFGDEATIMFMSDHGFCNFRRQFHPNAWLRNHGYLNPPSCRHLSDENRTLPDWDDTKAYAVGINGLYLNLAGREREGIVTASEREALLDEIAEGLLAVRDPENGQPVIARVYRREEIYHGPLVDQAPDLLIGYHRGYRASWSTTLGGVPKAELTDNKKAWSADHCIAAEEVPGVLFSNRPIRRSNPTLIDMAPTILIEFGVDVPTQMRGGSVFEPDTTTMAEASVVYP